MRAHLAERARIKVKKGKAFGKRRKPRSKEMGEVLQRELDAIVAPIDVEGKERLGKAASLGGESSDQVLPEQETEPSAKEGSKSEVAPGAKARKRRTDDSGIVIGETD